jgi:hypothetical protein
MNQRFEQQEPKRQAMTHQEVKAIVALWSRERAELQGVNAAPTTSDIAEALDITPAESQRLLTCVRARQDGIRKRQRRFAAVVALLGAVGAGVLLLPRSAPKVAQAPPAQVTPLALKVTFTPGRTLVERRFPNGGYEVYGSRITVRNGEIRAEGKVTIRGVAGRP